MTKFHWSFGLTFGLLTVAVKGLGQSPSEVVKEVMDLANSGKYSEMQKHFSEKALTLVKLSAAVGAGNVWQETWQKQVRNGTLEKVEVIKEEIDGDKAEVEYKKTFKDGSSASAAEALIKQNGRWKITIDRAQHEKRMQRKCEENATKLLAAVKTNDFREIFALYNRYQEEAKDIRDGNPKILWEKLLQQHYETKVRELDPSPSNTFYLMFWRDLRSLLTSASWRVTESRLRMEGGLKDIVRVYVSLEYSNSLGSPVVNTDELFPQKRRLKSGALQLDFFAENTLFFDYQRVAAGDVYWESGSTRNVTTQTNPVATTSASSLGSGKVNESEFAKLLNKYSDEKLFKENSKTFSASHSNVWKAVQEAIQKQKCKVVVSEQKKGIVVAERGFPPESSFLRFAINVHEDSHDSSTLRFKAFRYDRLPPGSDPTTSKSPPLTDELSRTFLDNQFLKSIERSLQKKE